MAALTSGRSKAACRDGRSKDELDAFARRASEMVFGRMVETVSHEAASASSRCTRPSDIGTWAQTMRRTMVGLIAGRLCALVAWVHPEGRKSEHGSIQKCGGKESAVAGNT